MKIVARTYAGFEEILQSEILKITNIVAVIERRAVSFEGSKSDVYKVNLWSRFAIDVLIPIQSFRAYDEEDLYKNSYQINWNDYLSVDQTLSISSIVHSRFFNHSKYAALKVKDAIVDYFKKQTGKRPNIDREDPDISLVVRISDKNVTLLLNTSGQPLFKRGYRTKSVEAPINEILAAGIIEISRWDSKTAFIDPMCGSGTFLCEAVMKANNIAPGLLRKTFCFEKANDFDAEIWGKIKEKAKNSIISSKTSIYGYDINSKSISYSLNNIKNIQAEYDVILECSDFFNLQKPTEKGVLVLNPPYDIRMKNQDIINFYANIGTRLKHFWENYDAWILSGNTHAIKNLGLRPKHKRTLFNGPLECKLIHLPIYKGSLKAKKSMSSK